MKKIRIVLALITIVSLLTGVAVFLLTGGLQHDVSPLVALGEKYLEEGDYEEAALQFERAIAIAEKNPEAWYGSARASIGLGDEDEAIEALKVVAELDPSQEEKISWMIEKIEAGEGEDVILLSYEDTELANAEAEPEVEAAIDFSKTYNMYSMNNISVVDEDENYYTISADLFGYAVIPVEQYILLSEGMTWQGRYHTYTVGPEGVLQEEGYYRYRELYGDDGQTYYVSLGYTGEYEGAQEEDSSFSTADIPFVSQNKDGKRYYAILPGSPFWGAAANGVHPFIGCKWGEIEYGGTYRIRKDLPLYSAIDWPCGFDAEGAYREFSVYMADGWGDSVSINENGEIVSLVYLYDIL